MSTHVVRHGVIRLAVAGEVDLDTVPSLREAITEMIKTDHPESLIVDHDAVDFLDSTGIAVLVEGRHLADACGTAYQIINAHDMVGRVLEITGILGHLTNDVSPGMSCVPQVGKPE
jgi:anti-anti-sigma factor